ELAAWPVVMSPAPGRLSCPIFSSRVIFPINSVIKLFITGSPVEVPAVLTFEGVEQDAARMIAKRIPVTRFIFLCLIISLNAVELIFSKSHTPCCSCEDCQRGIIQVSAFLRHQSLHCTHRCSQSLIFASEIFL